MIRYLDTEKNIVPFQVIGMWLPIIVVLAIFQILQIKWKFQC